MMPMPARCEACGRVVVRKRWCASCAEADRALASASVAETAIRATLYPSSEAVEVVRRPRLAPGRGREWRGAVVAGRYGLLERAGSGGTATVYRARDLAAGHDVALKVLHQALRQDELAVERFRREAYAMRSLRHPNIVRAFDYGVSDGVHYIVMEHVPGRSLKSVLASHGPLRCARAVDLVLQVLEAARFMHAHGVVHRDLKCANVIVEPGGQAKVTDLGIACTRERRITATDALVGTVEYVSPERLLGLAVTEACDIYSIGVMLYELVTGRVPFDGELVPTVALKHLHEPPVSPARVNRVVTPGLEKIIMRALEKAPEDRFADADAFAGALRREMRRSQSPAARSDPQAWGRREPRSSSAIPFVVAAPHGA
jgi:eukaryotic-like serine/threonine-protein kinase